ncbi:HNH endonuclease family protein [Paenarthrobacter sp. NPDC090522]|uniref:HNH endonuclease family protein n=1 Tax=Paenarthrobacter sp. NPDC090522 TaxID=3364383 RepID=UPI00382B61D1
MNTRMPAQLAALATAAALTLSACTLAPGAANAPAAPTGTNAPAQPGAAGTAGPTASAAALAALPSIPAKGRAPKTGYERELFGPAWKDVDRNGCDTRNDTLRRDLSGIEVKPGTRDCVVLSGQLADPYTGETVHFVRGGNGPGVDIDHLVPLADAWQKGAQSWDKDKRERFANDPANLAASSASANRSKGDSDLATWLPPNRAHWCDYTAGIVQVKATYGLWMTPAEHDRAAQILTECTR